MSRDDSKADPRQDRRRSRDDDPTRSTERQIDDNQDDLGRDVNDPGKVANEINRKAGERT